MQARLNSGTQNLGNASLIFTYNDADLSFSDSPVEGADYVFSNFQGSGYSSSISKPLAGTIVINIVYNLASGGSLLGSTYMPIVTLKFETINPQGSAGLVWKTEEFFAPNSTSQWSSGSWVDENTTPLPVQLVSFNAFVENNGIILKWSTATEINLLKFDVERSIDSISFQRVGSVGGSGTTAEIKNYSFNLGNPLPGIQYFRLKIVDTDGTSDYSDIIRIDASSLPHEFALYQNYPNPFNPSTTIKYALPAESYIILTIFNSIGEKISEFNEGIKGAGLYTINWKPENLSSGIYFYSISVRNIDGKSSFNKSQKMLLMK